MKSQITTKKIVRKELEIMPLFEDFVLPVKAKRGSIGYDLTVPRDIAVAPHSRVKVPLDFAINLPYGVEAKIEPRSGCSLRGLPGYGWKKKLFMLFGFLPITRRVLCDDVFDADVMIGKIDPNYTDNVHVLIKNNDEGFTLKAGTRIAQMTFYHTIAPFFRVVEELTSKSRGGGLGSSGTNRLTPVHESPIPAKEKEGGTKPASVFTTSGQEVPPSTSNEPTE